MKKDRLILSRDIGDPRMLQYDWLSSFQVVTEEADFSQTFGFSRIIKNTIMHHFQKRQPSRLNFWQNQKNPILEEFFGFSPKWEFFLKNSTPSISDMQNFRKILQAVFEKKWQLIYWHTDLLTEAVSYDPLRLDVEPKNVLWKPLKNCI